MSMMYMSSNLSVQYLLHINCPIGWLHLEVTGIRATDCICQWVLFWIGCKNIERRFA